MYAWEMFRYPGIEPRESVSDEIIIENIRLERDRRLFSSDWTQLPDVPVDKAAWAAYRQALRDLPSTITDPRVAVWPEEPSV